MRLLKLLPLRQQRSYLRKLERGDEVPELKAEDFEDSDFDFGSDFENSDDDFDSDEEEENDDGEGDSDAEELEDQVKTKLKV